MFRNGILFDKHEEDGFTYYNVAHRLRYNNEDYIARLVAREDQNGNLFYDHEFTEIKKIGAPASGREGNLPTSPHQSSAKILEDILLSKISDKNIRGNFSSYVANKEYIDAVEKGDEKTASEVYTPV